ncbi:MAG: EAL domain-containing protein [Cycloclasticus sp.]|nr:EAL domain-containing protein [Cycloclasticus sp.]
MVLYIQPIVSISSGTEHSKHCEVLVRMIDREGAIIPPGAFLPAAERYNLIQSVDCYVVKKSCEAYQNGLFGPVTTEQIISINLDNLSALTKSSIASNIR